MGGPSGCACGAEPVTAPPVASAIPFPPTRWSLVGRAPTGQEDATLVVERYADCLRRYLRLRFPRLGPADFDDLVQDVLLKLLEHPDLLSGASPRDGGRFRYYLATVALNQARNALRLRQRTQQRECGLGDEPLTAATPEVDAAWHESLLASAWADLRGWAGSGELEADIPGLLEEHLVHNVSLRDLAERHGLALSTCQRRIAKGRTWLQQAIISRDG